LVRKPELPGVIGSVPLPYGGMETGGLDELVLMGATLDSVVTGSGDEMAAGGLLADDAAEGAAPDGEAVTVTVSLVVTVTVTAGGQEAPPAPAPAELPALTFVGKTVMVSVVVEVVDVVVNDMDGGVDMGLTAREEARQMVVVTTVVEVPVPRV